MLTQAFEAYRTPASTARTSVTGSDSHIAGSVNNTGVRLLNPNIATLANSIQQVGYQSQGSQGVRLLNPEPDSPSIPMPMSSPPPLPRPAVRQAAHQFEGGFDTGMPMTMQGNMMGGQFFDSPNVVGIPDDYRFVSIPLLDLIVVEAEGPRLNRFIEMIRQIEELSKLNRPKIEVVHLKHVNNVSLGAVLPQIYNAVFQTIPGAVQIIPMTSPNAMMLVGWGEAMDTARELIETLDQPAATEHSRLHVFKLQHISAQQARTVLNGAFPAPVGLSGFIARLQLFHEPRTNALIVQAAPNDLEEVKLILREIDVADSGVKLQMQMRQLKHSLAPDVQQTVTQAITGGATDGKVPAFELLVQGAEGQRLIKSGIMSDVTINTDVRNNQIIIRSPESSMAFILELIDLLDIASPEAEIKIFQLEYADASSLRDMLTSLIPSNVDGVPGPQLPGTVDGDKLIPIRFAVDIRTNSIVAAGSASDLRTIEALIINLDREDILSRESEVYFLKNMRATNVAQTINEYIRSRRDIRLATPGVIPPFQEIESEVIVVADAESNSLIISATPRYFTDIIKLVKELDRSPPQVMIRVLIAEVTLSDASEWSAEIGLQDPMLLGRSSEGRGGMLFNTDPNTAIGTAPGNTPGNVATQLLSNFGGQRVGPAGFGGLGIAASSDFIHLQLRALHEDKRLEVLSAPQITTMNNQEAAISTGQKVPRYHGMMMTTTGSQADIRDENVSLMLRVTPNISPDGTIVMLVRAQNQKLGTLTQVGDQFMQSIDDTNIVTMISAADNETVVLGGLITRNEDKLQRKIPFLGDLPLLGKFFRQEISQTQRKELLIILTPRIIRSPEEMERVRQMEMARMSWCLENVSDTYGNIDAYNVRSPRPYTGDVPVSMPEPVKMESLQPLETQIPAPVLPKR